MFKKGILNYGKESIYRKPEKGSRRYRRESIRARKQLEEAKAKQAEAQNKVREREKEIMQEENNDLADKVRLFFGEDIIPDEFEKEMNELLLINEVREYIESEREKRNSPAKNNGETYSSSEAKLEETTHDYSSESHKNMITQ